MPDSSRVIHEFNRGEWTVQDLRDLVAQTNSLPASSPVFLTAASPQSRAGTVEVAEEA